MWSWSSLGVGADERVVKVEFVLEHVNGSGNIIGNMGNINGGIGQMPLSVIMTISGDKKILIIIISMIILTLLHGRFQKM